VTESTIAAPDEGVASPAAVLLPLLVAGVVAAFLLSVALGPIPIRLSEIGAALFGGSVDAMLRDVILDLRIPRALMALSVGAVLAVGGTAMQGLFRNPLADPTLIGVSGGAALAAASFIVFGASLTFIPDSLRLYAMPVAAFLGGIVVVFVIQRLAQRDGRTDIATMLLAGIAVNAVVMAGIGLLTFIGNDAQLRTINFWMLGSLGGSGWGPLSAVGPVALVVVLVCLGLARVLDGMMLGEREAQTLGFEVETAKRLLIIAVAAGVGAAVAFSGMIVFVGIVAPHMVRLAIGPAHRALLVGAALLGGILLLLADTLCRLIVVPAELPIGIVTSLLGAPFFLALLMGRSRTFGEGA
jgi:iron complex transport system permease protein